MKRHILHLLLVAVMATGNHVAQAACPTCDQGYDIRPTTSCCDQGYDTTRRNVWFGLTGLSLLALGTLAYRQTQRQATA